MSHSSRKYNIFSFMVVVHAHMLFNKSSTHATCTSPGCRRQNTYEHHFCGPNSHSLLAILMTIHIWSTRNPRYFEPSIYTLSTEWTDFLLGFRPSQSLRIFSCVYIFLSSNAGAESYNKHIYITWIYAHERITCITLHLSWSDCKPTKYVDRHLGRCRQIATAYAYAYMF